MAHFHQFRKRKKEVIEALEQCGRDKNFYFSALLVTDVVTQKSLLLVAGHRQVLELIDYPEIEAGIWELENVVSRKKRLLPYLTHSLKQVT